MKPEIQELISLDVYRDGGSLSASYRDSEGTQRVLMFSIDNAINENEGALRSYKSASVESYIKIECENPITGIPYQKTEMKEEQVSWELATNILESLEPLISKFNSEYLWVFKSMVEIASNENHTIKYS